MTGDAVVLLSGGLDSATVLALARSNGMRCHALTVRYGQRHGHEIECAERVARALGAAEHRTLEIDLSGFGGSSLFPGGEIPKGEDPSGRSSIPSTYVPARNTILLSLALGWAEVLDAEAIYLGVNALDYSGYPDCRPEFLEAFRGMAALATRRGVEGRPIEIRAPLLRLTKGEIIRRGLELGVDYGMTTSCYDPDQTGAPCRCCDACTLRARGFRDAGVQDPLLGGP
jgi:7-cyano-7-deazaguanine synthase